MILEISGKTVDLPPTTRGLVRLNKSVAALTDLDTRTGEYSWPLTLPNTRRNAGIFGQILHPQTLDKFVLASFPFVLSAGGVVWRGIFNLTGLRGGYTGTLSTENLGWATGLGEKKLPELTTLEAVAYDGTQLETLLQGDCDTQDLQFPLVAYGNFFSPPTTDDEGNEVPSAALQVIDTPLAVDDYAPSVYYLSVLRAILREAGGYFPMGPILSDEAVRRWVIPAAGGSGDYWPWGLLLPGRVERQQPYTHYLNAQGVNTANGSADDFLWFGVGADTVVSGGTRALRPGTTTYTAPRAGAYSFAWEAVISAASQQFFQSGNIDVHAFTRCRVAALALLVSRGGEGYEGAHSGLGNYPTPRLESGQQRLLTVRRLDTTGSNDLPTGGFTGTVANLYLDAADTVQLVLLMRREVLDAEGRLDVARSSFSVTFSSAFLACTASDGPTSLRPAAVLPGISQKDLLRDFLIRTNTVPVVDLNRRAVHLLSREAHTQAQGAPVTLDDVADLTTLEYLPVFGGVARVVFQPADAEGVPSGTDTVAVRLASTGTDKPIVSPFAATTVRQYYVVGPGGGTLVLPTVATEEELNMPRSEASQTVTGKAARVLLYSPPLVGGTAVGFQERTVVPGRGTYLGTPLSWDGPTGAVAAHYRGFLAQAARGHLCRVGCSLTPALYGLLSPGRRVYLQQAEYQIESIDGFDPDSVSLATLTLLRRV